MVDISLSVMCVCGCVSSGREQKHISFFLRRHWNSDGIYCSQFRMCFFLGKKESRWQIDMGLSAWCRRKEIQREGKREREREKESVYSETFLMHQNSFVLSLSFFFFKNLKFSPFYAVSTYAAKILGGCLLTLSDKLIKKFMADFPLSP